MSKHKNNSQGCNFLLAYSCDPQELHRPCDFDLEGHLRSPEVKTLKRGHWGQNFKTIPRDAIFCMHTHMTPRNNIAYFYLTSKVKGGHRRSKHKGHWRSKNANWGHTLMKTLRDAIFCMHTLIVSIDIWDCKMLTSKVIRGHWRSKTSK